MNNTFLYEETFDDLIALLVTLYSININVYNIKSEKNYQGNLLDSPIKLEIKNKEEKIKCFYEKVNYRVINTIYYIFLSEEKDKELLIYNFVKLSFKYKNKVFYQRNIDIVNISLKVFNKVLREAHKLKGFLRFRYINNDYYYAEINPTNNILYIISFHFKNRFRSEKFIIKDINRNLYCLYENNKIYLLENENLNININNKKDNIEDLWKTFFKTISIKERKNLKVQRNFMPKKYWKYILEMEDKI